MRCALWLACALVICLTGGQHASLRQAPAVDPRQAIMGNVLPALEFCQQGVMFSRLSIEMAHLGDEVSVKILRGLNQTELTSPERIKGYLCLVRLAFRKPETITRAEDKVPGVTMFLLEYLKERSVRNEDLNAQIDSAKAFVKQQTDTDLERPLV